MTWVPSLMLTLLLVIFMGLGAFLISRTRYPSSFRHTPVSASLELRFQVPTNMPGFFSSEGIEMFKWGQKFRSSCLRYRPSTRLTVSQPAQF